MIAPRPILCLVTDRSRLSALGRQPREGADPLEPLLDLLALAAEAGIQLLQLREPDLSARDLGALVARARERIGDAPARLVVNDRVDVALAAAAGGVHLKGESIATARVRGIVPEGTVIGRSVHTLEDAQEAARAGADYLIFGTVFETRSKGEGHVPAGLGRLQAVVEAVSVPVLAIGGVTVERLPAVAATGAAGVAAIGLFHQIESATDLDDRGASAADRVRAHLAAVVEAARRAFA